MKIICKDYRKKEGGKGCASFVGGGGLCCVPDRIRCIQWLLKHQDQTSIQELLSHKEFPEIPCNLRVQSRAGEWLHIEAGGAMRFAEGLLKELQWTYSFSQLWSCYVRCRRKWYLTYLKRVCKVEEAHWFPVGSAGHKVLERYLSGMPIAAAVNEVEEYEAKDIADKYYSYRLAAVKASCRVWAEIHDGLRMRVEVFKRHPLLPMTGFCDGEEETQEGGLEAWEHKFAGSLDYKPLYGAQANFYFGLDPNLEAVNINILKKPSMAYQKPKAGESTKAYEARMYELMKAKPKEWFAIHRVEKNQRTLDSFNECTLYLIDELERARAANFNLSYFPRNYNECTAMYGNCEFLELCESGRIDPRIYIVEGGKGGRARDEEEDKG